VLASIPEDRRSQVLESLALVRGAMQRVAERFPCG
jgi:hypothetical protein